MEQTNPPMDNIKYVVFDFDGTLSNTMDAILDNTTSIPTPRPEYSVTFSFVENPGNVMN